MTESVSIFTVDCPSCDTTFPVDSDKVPRGGVRARCSVCGGIFPVTLPTAPAPGATAQAGPAVGTPVPPATADRVGEAAFPEGGPDPDHGPEPWSGVDEETAGEPDAPSDVALAEEWEVEAEVAPSDVEEPPAEDLMEVEVADEPMVEAPPEEPSPAPDMMEPDDVAADEGWPAPEVDVPPGAPAAETPAGKGVGGGAVDEAAPLPQAFQFGRRDPHDKARRLARVLVSDIITYNPERYLRALENDTLQEDFEEEIRKSWTEYVDQVGSEIARETNYWTEALNDLLARGRQVF